MNRDDTNRGPATSDGTTDEDEPAIDPVTLEVLRNQLESIAEEMGQTLIRGAYSPNIKERRDCSTALFDARGRMVAQAEHIPVHLGAMLFALVFGVSAAVHRTMTRRNRVG